MQDLEMKIYTGLLSDYARLRMHREQMVAAKMGLSSSFVTLWPIEKAEHQKMGPAFEQFIDKLPPDVYKVTLIDDHGKSAHAVVFIKTPDQCFVFESNQATLALSKEESAAQLWKICKDGYLKKGLCSMRFNRISS